MGDRVFAKNFGQGQRWLPSVVTEVTGPVSYMVKLQDGRLIRRHQDHLRIRRHDSPSLVTPEVVVDKEAELCPLDDESITIPDPITEEPEPQPVVEVDSPPTSLESNSNSPSAGSAVDERTSQGAGHPSTPTPAPVPPRKSYPRRDRRDPDWFDGKRRK